jgi:hypothetical protein
MFNSTSYINRISRVVFSQKGRTPRVFLWICLLVLVSKSIDTQAQLGTWKNHFNYQKTKDLVIVGDKIFCISETGFFYYDIQARESTTLSKIDGLSETGIATLGYNAPLKTLVLAYQSGNIDLLVLNSQNEPEKIQNLPFLKETNAISGSKQVYSIDFKNKTAYLSSAFGLMILDLEKQEIRETYQNLGQDAARLPVFSTTFVGDSIFIATPQGILGSSTSASVNLQDFANWKTLRSGAYTRVGALGQSLFALNDDQELYERQNNRWIRVLSGIRNFQISGNTIVVNSSQTAFYQTSNTPFISIRNSLFRNLQKGVFQGQTLWLADFGSGLLGNLDNNNFGTYSPPSTDTLYASRRDSIISDLDGNLWAKQPFGGILVRSKTGQSRFLGTARGEGSLPSSNVNSLVMDRDGQIWIATDRGVAVFDNPTGVFQGRNVDAYSPIIDRRRLLANEVVTAVGVDGGNRKWFGTRNGLFLFNADGTELLESFNEKNSPLPSNEIRYIFVEKPTGEVYIRTAKGMVSYKGTASESQETQDENAVKIYPNPVRPSFTGLVGIEGLVQDAYVKIVDAAGRLVFETRAAGGTATWNARTPTGTRVQGGVYFVLSANAKGNESIVGKIAVID